MLLTYEEYTALGYAQPEAAFGRLEPMAETMVGRYTSGRVTPDGITEMGKRGVAEIVEVLSADGGGALRSFSNGKYGESYERSKTADELILDLVACCFPPDDVWRGAR